MIILSNVYSIDDIRGLGDFPNGFVKGVVDIEKRLVALDADMHYELADFLREERGSSDKNIWGFNLWLDSADPGDILEFDSMINIRNNQLHGYPRGGLSICDSETEALATEVIGEWIMF